MDAQLASGMRCPFAGEASVQLALVLLASD